MDVEGGGLSEISQRNTSTIGFHLYVESKKQNTNKQKMKTDPNNKLVVAREEVGKGWMK